MAKEIPYIASGKEIEYRIPKGLVAMLANASKKEEKDIWVTLSELGNICVARLEAKRAKGNRWGNSWTKKTFPDTAIELRYSANLCNRQKPDGAYRTYFSVEIQVAGYKYEKFTQKQIDDYIVEGILLGDGLEADENIETSN